MTSSLLAKYGLKRVVNASGRMSILGVSAPTDTVMEAMKQGGQNYVEMAQLVERSGQYIAQMIGSEAAVVVNSASSGVALSVAAVVTAGDERTSMQLHQQPIEKSEIIMFKGHNVNYGVPIETMIYLGGGKVVEVGSANEGKAHHIEQAINERTAAILYVKSHHAVQKNTISEVEAWEVAQRHNIPFIIDAAAEEDLQRYVACSDLVIYSGSKAIEGPTSGLVCGKERYIDWLRVQLYGIGRSMKVGKEAIFGLLQALDEYADKQDNSEQEKVILQQMMVLNELPGVTVTIVQDEAGRPIYRGRVQIEQQTSGTTAVEVAQSLQAGDIAIYTRDYGVKQGFFDIDVRSLQGDDMDIIVTTIQQLITKGV
ncbi:DgaE family pyridoxal phosphate-dependent ammonia lyase [Paenibacillus yanchengensis]|uniref:DgaE family pyridoxal phosphate-dependent ammonia lyase n=1 Tax=Paenibacillus yanchengensis TaxID=2035833 RepID=A0ABW4YIQ1_9BACL